MNSPTTELTGGAQVADAAPAVVDLEGGKKPRRSYRRRPSHRRKSRVASYRMRGGLTGGATEAPVVPAAAEPVLAGGEDLEGGKKKRRSHKRRSHKRRMSGGLKGGAVEAPVVPAEPVLAGGEDLEGGKKKKRSKRSRRMRGGLAGGATEAPVVPVAAEPVLAGGEDLEGGKKKRRSHKRRSHKRRSMRGGALAGGETAAAPTDFTAPLSGGLIAAEPMLDELVAGRKKGPYVPNCPRGYRVSYRTKRGTLRMVTDRSGHKKPSPKCLKKTKSKTRSSYKPRSYKYAVGLLSPMSSMRSRSRRRCAAGKHRSKSGRCTPNRK